MGTRSLTVLKSGDQEICVLYRQFDGYPEGHGKELAEFLAGKAVVNGIRGDANTVFNGPSAMAAQVVAHFVDPEETGGFYLHGPGTRGIGEEYIYEVSAELPRGFVETKNPIAIKMTGYRNFDGTPEQFLEMLSQPVTDDE